MDSHQSSCTPSKVSYITSKKGFELWRSIHSQQAFMGKFCWESKAPIGLLGENFESSTICFSGSDELLRRAINHSGMKQGDHTRTMALALLRNKGLHNPKCPCLFSLAIEPQSLIVLWWHHHSLFT